MTEEDVEIQVELGFLLSPLRSRIEIVKSCDERLAAMELDAVSRRGGVGT